MISFDLVCFSHLRWDFVYQRPQHLLSRFAYNHRVLYIQESIYNDKQDGYTLEVSKENVSVVTMHLFNDSKADRVIRQEKLLKKILAENNFKQYIFWYYTPMAFEFSKYFQPQAVVYDCMDELSNFKFASPVLRQMEDELFAKADIVFTGGYSLYHAKKNRHAAVYPFPSSIDKGHFSQARGIRNDEPDQQHIAHPRLAFAGVIDERFDIDLLKNAALLKPEWQFIFIGPVVKISYDELPKLPNIHYLGSKHYDELPKYISGWDICLIPFAINDSTKFISPTKTPEYLAAGKPVISTAITDVVNPYGEAKLVHIIHSAKELIERGELELN